MGGRAGHFSLSQTPKKLRRTHATMMLCRALNAWPIVGWRACEPPRIARD